MDIIQCRYSLLDREVEDELLPLCKENNIVLQAYSPLSMGILSGAVPRDYVPPKGSARNGKKWFKPENLAKVDDMLDSWKPLCEKYHCTLANLAIAWVLNQSDNINVLSGSTSIDQLDENSKAMKIIIEPDDLRRMREMAEDLDN